LKNKELRKLLNNSTSIEEFKKKLEEVDISNFIEIKNIV
jgi:hypothetical protein